MQKRALTWLVITKICFISDKYMMIKILLFYTNSAAVNNTGRTEAHNQSQNAGAHTELTADPREAGSDRLHAAGFRGGNARTRSTD